MVRRVQEIYLGIVLEPDSMTGAYTFKRFVPGEGQDHRQTPKGHWCGFQGSIQKEGGITEPRLHVNITCPECGQMGMLPHRITSLGSVFPSIVCTGKGCMFHTQPNTLEGWDHGERPDTKGD